MAFHFELDRENGIFRVVGSGRVDDGELRELYRVVGERFARSGARAAILDVSAVTDFAVTSALIEQLSRGQPALHELETPRLIVAPQPHVYGAMRVFQSIGEPTRPRLLVLRSAAEAYALLGVAAPKFEKMEE
ncbi:MAG: hypothetical protein HYX28_05240 [Candidatus Koribacter versatilis]|uniref:STAS domain-containing protein n=1 Tax=Candidatus Korobacter versatilis TaxID=658062 RepID=A0A932EPH4_9BACT|nr:hypothetical protein [Candidatus Koribacter versatilis]